MEEKVMAGSTLARSTLARSTPAWVCTNGGSGHLSISSQWGAGGRQCRGRWMDASTGMGLSTPASFSPHAAQAWACVEAAANQAVMLLGKARSQVSALQSLGDCRIRCSGGGGGAWVFMAPVSFSPCKSSPLNLPLYPSSCRLQHSVQVAQQGSGGAPLLAMELHLLANPPPPPPAGSITVCRWPSRAVAGPH